MAAASALGRLGWAATSDVLGRKNTFFVFGLGVPGAIAVPAITGMVGAPTEGTLPLTLFCGTTFAMVTFYGGLMSVAPAYVGDLFGAKHQARPRRARP